MNVIIVSGVPKLERLGTSFALDAADWNHLRRMTPMGRKVYFRRKAKSLLSSRPEDPRVALLLEWTCLPAREWAFDLPAEPIEFCLPR